MNQSTMPHNAPHMGRKASEEVTAYLSIQNDLLRFSFAKALGLKRPETEKALARLVPVRSALEELLEQLRQSNLSDGDETGRFLISLRGYVRSVLEGLTVFESFCHSMQNAITTKNRQWKKETQPQLLSELQQAEQKWLAQGLKLNELWKALPLDESSKTNSQKKTSSSLSL